MALTTKNADISLLNKSAETTSRFSNYVSLLIHYNTNITISAKVDTGAARTIFRFIDFDKQLDDFDYVYGNLPVLDREIKAANGNVLDVRLLTVESLRLSDEIMFENLQVGISKDLKTASLLGMDVLSLFDFRYYAKSKEISLIDYIRVIEHLKQYNLNPDLACLNLSFIASLAEEKKGKNGML